MRALSIDRPGLAQIVDRAHPVAGPGEVLLQVAFAGLCGTDLSAFLGKNPLVAYPRVIGHEISGRVVEIGPGVDRAWIGAAAAVSPYKNCGACPACRLGRPNACRNNETLGVQRDGALAEYAAVPASRLVPSADAAARCAGAGRAVLDRHARGAAYRGHLGGHRPGAGLWRGRRRRHRRRVGAWRARHRIGPRRAEARAGPSSRRRRGRRRPRRCGRTGARAHRRRRPIGRDRGSRIAGDLSARAGAGGAVWPHRLRRMAQRRRAARGAADRAEGSGDSRLAQCDRRADGGGRAV